MLITEINEIRQDLRNFRNGKLAAEDFQIHLNAYKQTEKRARDFLTAWGLALKSGFPTNSQIKRIAEELVGNEKIKLIENKPDRTVNRGR